MLSTRHGVRVLGPADLAAFLALAARDPVVNVFVDYRARTTNLEPRWLGGEVWGRFADGELVAACHVGANLVPVEASADDARVFAERALTRGRTVSTIVGPQDPVRAFWEGVAAAWGRPRERAGTSRTSRSARRRRSLRTRRSGAPRGRPRRALPRLRGDVHRGGRRLARAGRGQGPLPHPGEPADLARLVVRPLRRGSSGLQGRGGLRVAVRRAGAGRLGAARPAGPGARGRRHGRGGRAGRRDLAPVVSLYVNDYNMPARPAYERVGFRQTATFATIMF